MKARTETSPSLEWAADRYKTIRGTIKKAKENGINIIRHWVKYTNRGAIYQHWFIVRNEDGTLTNWTNQHLSGHIWVYTQGKNKKPPVNPDPDQERDQPEYLNGNLIHP